MNPRTLAVAALALFTLVFAAAPARAQTVVAVYAPGPWVASPPPLGTVAVATEGEDIPRRVWLAGRGLGSGGMYGGCFAPCTVAAPPGSYELRAGQFRRDIIVQPWRQSFTAVSDGPGAAWGIPLGIGIALTAVGAVTTFVGWVMSDPICIDWSLFGTDKCVGPGPAHPTADAVMLTGGVMIGVGVAAMITGAVMRVATSGGIRVNDRVAVVPSVAPVAGGAMLGVAGYY